MSTPDVSITVDGRPYLVPAGRSLAAALLMVGIRELRRSPRASGSRGAFCMMGVCQECAIRVDGQLRQACMEIAREGMAVRLGTGLG